MLLWAHTATGMGAKVLCGDAVAERGRTSTVSRRLLNSLSAVDICGTSEPFWFEGDAFAGCATHPAEAPSVYIQVPCVKRWAGIAGFGEIVSASDFAFFVGRSPLGGFLALGSRGAPSVSNR